VDKGGTQGFIMIPVVKCDRTLIVEEILVAFALLAAFAMLAHYNATI
jgi:hypothetical protein